MWREFHHNGKISVRVQSWWMQRWVTHAVAYPCCSPDHFFIFLNTQHFFFLDWICYSKQLNMNVLLVLAMNLHSLRAAWNTESMWLKNWLCKQGICLRGWRKIGKIQLAKACHTLVYFKTVRKFQHLQFSFLYRYTKWEASFFKNQHEMPSPPYFFPILITSSLWN